MKDVHCGRGIEAHHFDLVAKHPTASLQAAGVPQDLVDTIISAIAPLSGDILSG